MEIKVLILAPTQNLLIGTVDQKALHFRKHKNIVQNIYSDKRETLATNDDCEYFIFKQEGKRILVYLNVLVKLEEN